MKRIKLGEIVDQVIDNRGKNPPYYSLDGIPVVDNYLIDNQYHLNLSDVKRYISQEVYDSFLRDFIQENDLLVTLVGNGYGKCCLAPKETCAIIQNTIGLRPTKEIANKYIYYLILSAQPAIRSLNRGAAQPSIKVSDLLKLDFCIHNTTEQQHIVDTI